MLLNVIITPRIYYKDSTEATTLRSHRESNEFPIMPNPSPTPCPTHRHWQPMANAYLAMANDGQHMADAHPTYA